MRTKVELKWALLALLVLSAPLVSFADEYGDDEEEGAAAAADDDEKDVVVLTEKNFEEMVKKQKYTLVRGLRPCNCPSLDRDTEIRL